MASNSIQAILFDLDGVLRNSGPTIYNSIIYSLKKHTGRIYSKSELEPYIHHHEEVYKRLASHIDKKLFMDTYWEALDKLWHTIELYENTESVLELLKRRGYRLAIVSSAGDAKKFLRRMKLTNYFDAVIEGPDTVEHKPSPDPVNLALKKLGAKNKQAIFVGDLGTDIKSARAAGLRVSIGITHGMGSSSALKNSGADYIVKKLQELPELIEKLGL